MKRWSRRPWLIALPVFAALVGWGWWSTSTAVREAHRELAELERRRDELERANRELERQIDGLRREREARARAARETMDVAAPGETVVIVPPSPTPAVRP